MGYRYQLIDAVTWKIVAELMRRHCHSSELRVFETHPGGGQYDCLSLRKGYDNLNGTHLCDFHAKGIHIHLKIGDFHRIFEWRGHDDYISAFLKLQDPKPLIDELEKQLQLPDMSSRKIPPTTPPVLIYRIISEILQRYVFAREMLFVECGWYDSSYDCHSRKELLHFPSIRTELERDHLPETRFMVSSRFWLLYPESEPERKVVLDLNGIIYFQSNPNTGWEVIKEYQNSNRRLGPLVEKICAQWPC